MRFYKNIKVNIPAKVEYSTKEIAYVDKRKDLKWSLVAVPIINMSTNHIKNSIKLIKTYKDNSSDCNRHYCGYNQRTWVTIFETELAYRKALQNAELALDVLARFSKV